MNRIDPSSLPLALPPADLAALSASHGDVTILDVRTPAEYESSRIPGSYNVPLELLAEHAADLRQAAGGPVVLVCRSGMRASQAEQTLRAADLPRLHVLDGGLAAWEAGGLPTIRGRQRWSMERQVRGVAGGLALTGALGGLLVWRPLAGIAAGIGGGLLVSALTDTCTMAKVLAKLPYNRAATCDVDAVVRSIGTGSTLPTAAD